MKAIKMIGLFAAMLSISSVAYAAEYPAKAVTLIVPSAPGGSTDLVARLIGDELQQRLGRSVIVDNRPGASGNIGTVAVARAAPDGYTLLLQYSGYHVGNPALFTSPGWKPSDFAPVALVMRAPHVIAVSGALPVNTLQEFIDHGKKGGKGLFYASSGNGSIQHIAGELFAQQANVQVTHVPYKGAGPVIPDLVSGQVDAFITTPPSVLGQVQTGRLKALAYAGPQRHPSMPDVPTSAEAGLPGYEVESWFALFAPAGTPPNVLERLSSEVQQIVNSEQYKQKIEDQGAFAAYMDGPTLKAFVDKELDAWAKVVKDAGIKAN